MSESKTDIEPISMDGLSREILTKRLLVLDIVQGQMLFMEPEKSAEKIRALVSDDPSMALAASHMIEARKLDYDSFYIAMEIMRLKIKIKISGIGE